jgi:extradiol dioxygenase family protein
MSAAQHDRPRFHLAIPVDDLASARHFYGTVIGCPEGRSSERWVDFDLYGHQLVVHLAERASSSTNPVDGDDVPVPHFGLLLDPPRWQLLADRRLRDPAPHPLRRSTGRAVDDVRT